MSLEVRPSCLPPIQPAGIFFSCRSLRAVPLTPRETGHMATRVWDLRWLFVAVVLLCPHALHGQSDPPPAYPRPGATRMLENDRVIVWDIAWLMQEYPVHRHRYAHVGVYYQSGDRIITSTEGVERPVSTEAWNISSQAADVTHAEAGASAEPLRAVFIQIKPDSGGPMEVDGAVPLFPVDSPLERQNDERAHVWEYRSGSASARNLQHRHLRDAVVVSFNADLEPEVRYVERGTVHDTELPEGAARAFVFEIK